MLPELAVAYVVGAAAAGGLLCAHTHVASKRSRSKEMSNLQNNLSLLGLYWSERSSQALKLEEGNPRDEHQRYMRDLLIFGFMGVALSWVGFFFHFVIFISMKYIAVPRIERDLFSSRLAREKLTFVDVENELARLRATHHGLT